MIMDQKILSQKEINRYNKPGEKKPEKPNTDNQDPDVPSQNETKPSDDKNESGTKIIAIYLRQVGTIQCYILLMAVIAIGAGGSLLVNKT